MDDHKPLTLGLAAKLTWTIIKAFIHRLPEFPEWEPEKNVAPERRSKFRLGLQLMALCGCPDNGAYRLSWDGLPRDKEFLSYSDGVKEDMRSRSFLRPDSHCEYTELSPEMECLYRRGGNNGFWEALYVHKDNGLYIHVTAQGDNGSNVSIKYWDSPEAQELLRRYLHSKLG